MSLIYGYPPRLMKAREAARYLGMSESKFRSIGLTSKKPDGNRYWDVRDLDDYADQLDYDGETSCETKNRDKAAAAFGMPSSKAAA